MLEDFPHLRELRANARWHAARCGELPRAQARGAEVTCQVAELSVGAHHHDGTLVLELLCDLHDALVRARRVFAGNGRFVSVQKLSLGARSIEDDTRFPARKTSGELGDSKLIFY